MPKPHSTLPGYVVPGYEGTEPPPIGTAAYEEWLMDISVELTFPASDPPSTTQPGTNTTRPATKH